MGSIECLACTTNRLRTDAVLNVHHVDICTIPRLTQPEVPEEGVRLIISTGTRNTPFTPTLGNPILIYSTTTYNLDKFVK